MMTTNTTTRVTLDNGRITLINGDCLEILPKIKPGVIDMVFADLPYGTTANKWDSLIPLDELWLQFNNCAKIRAPMVFTATQPFSSALVMSNASNHAYEWIWVKNIATGYQIVKYKPLQKHETIQVFYREAPTYNPQMSVGKPYTTKRKPIRDYGEHLYGNTIRTDTVNNGTRYPTTTLDFPRETGYHPTQKPVKLLEYLIKTYTNENDVVLDPTAGSGTTAVAAIKTGRRCIAIEKDTEKGYFAAMVERCEKAIAERDQNVTT